MTHPSELERRLQDFAHRLGLLERELADLRRLARPAAAEPVAPPPPAVSPPLRPSAYEPLPAPAPPRVPPPRRPARPRREFDWSVFMGAKALAWAGGLVTLLGIVFFFVLAVNRGWIGPTTRVALGSVASAALFLAGLYIKRRFDELYHSALAAVGAGIAGGYMTLLAAKVLYDLVPNWAALVLAAAIAAAGVATALVWSSELVAGLGLIGATLAPGAIGLDTGDLSSAGTGFAALVFAGTAIVAIRNQWQTLLLAGIAASLPQVVVLIAQAEPTEWNVVAAAAFFWLLYLGTAIGWQDRLNTSALASFPASLILLSGVVAGGATSAQFVGRREGWMLLGVAAVYGAASALLFAPRLHRDLSALLAAVGLAIAAFALADLLSGPTLSVAWAAEAAVLAWLARRIDEVRYQIASLAYLTAAVIHAVLLDAPFRQLYEASDRPATGGTALIAVALGGSIVAYYSRPWPQAEGSGGVFRFLEPYLDLFRRTQWYWHSLVGWASALAALYVCSLGLLGLAELLSDDVALAFEWGHVGVVALWSLVALGTLAGGLRWSSTQIRVGGLVWFVAVLAESVRYVNAELHGDRRDLAFLIAAAALLAGALLDRLTLGRRSSIVVAAPLIVASLGLAFDAVTELVDGKAAAIDLQGSALLGLAAVYALIAALVLRRDRDLSSALWMPALVVAAYASIELLSGTWLVLAWAAAAASLAALGARAGEQRFQLASFAYFALALGHTFGFEAPPVDFFQASRHPEDGVPALLFVVGAAAAFAMFQRGKAADAPSEPTEYEAFAYALESRRETWRRTAEAVAAVLAMYAISLAILGLAEAVGGASVTTNFERGHSAVSAVWGVVGLVVLYVGLNRGLTWLRLTGFGLFAVALAKLFLFDLANLSSITRALSFLAVGAVLLLAGFFVQRFSAQRSNEPA